jgi:ParB family chromosome partitioning protein
MIDEITKLLVSELKEGNFQYFTEAKYIQTILNRGVSQIDLALMLGISPSTISNKVRLLKLPDPVKKKCIEFNVIEKIARELLPVEEEMLQLQMLKDFKDKDMSIAEFSKYVNSIINKTPDQIVVSIIYKF